MMQLSVQFNLTVTMMKFYRQKNNNDKAYFRLYNKHAGLLPRQNKPFQKISDFFLFLISLETFEIC